MTYRPEVQPRAEDDIADAFAWYEERAPGIGSEFVRAIDAVLAVVRRDPELYPRVHGEVRRGLLRRFPYGLFYVVREDVVVVLACLHVRRDPDTWPR